MTEDEKAAIAAEVTDATSRYFHGYSAAVYRCLTEGMPIDYDALGFWAFPLLFVTGTEERTDVSVVACVDFDAQIRVICEEYRQGGWAGTLELEETAVSVISADLALIETAGRRFCADGGVYNRWKSCYWLRRSAGGWRQFAVVETDPPRPTAGQWVDWLQSWPL
jgi:hypothetical protein